MSMAKSYFLAQASHDLRQPLQALQLFTNALESSNPTPEQQPLINKIDASVGNFRLLLDNLLDLSKLDFDKIVAEPKNFNLSALLQRLCVEYREVGSAQKISVGCKMSLVWVYSDSVLVERIVRNLLSNAIKYAKSKVVLMCEENAHHVIIRVLDDGVGICSKDSVNIYDEFYQCSNSTDNQKTGAGLGLNIVKRLVKILKAKISMRSKLNKYTVFSLYLPHRM